MARSERRTPAHNRRVPPTHLAHATAFTRTGERDMKNRKPFRTKRLKAAARRMASKGDDGAFRSAAPVSFHN